MSVVVVVAVTASVEDGDHLLVATTLLEQVARVALALVAQVGVDVLELVLLHVEDDEVKVLTW